MFILFLFFFYCSGFYGLLNFSNGSMQKNVPSHFLRAVLGWVWCFNWGGISERRLCNIHKPQ